MEVREVCGVLILGEGETVNKEEDTDRNNDYIVSQSSRNAYNLSWENFLKILFLQFCCILQKVYRSYDFIIIILNFAL